MKIDKEIHLSFKDILLVPYDKGICHIASRNDPVITSEIVPGKKLKIPIISSPMSTVTGIEMCVALGNAGALGVYTRHINDPDELNKQILAVQTISKRLINGYIAVAIGVKTSVQDRIKALADVGAEIIVIDIANGNSIHMINALQKAVYLRDHGYGHIGIVAGNVATPDAACRLASLGADAIKIGIGPGGACTTRRVTGFGYPQLEAIINCHEKLVEMNLRNNVRLIADGGIRCPGDATKALWAGADTVMLGYVLSGHTECPLLSSPSERIHEIYSQPKRWYAGMSSRTVHGRSDIAAEGVCIEVPFRGNVAGTIAEYAAGIRSGMTFANAMTLDELRTNVTAIRVSTLTQYESDPVSE